MAKTPTTAPTKTAESQRLDEALKQGVPWRQWGPYLSERQWGTVREDWWQCGAIASMPHAARLAALFCDKAIVRRTPKRSMRLRRLMELAPKIFGRDSPLEGDGFEPSVPGDTPWVPTWKMSIVAANSSRSPPRN